MAQLTLSFLGTFQVKLGDKSITKFRSANVQGLLVYLALHPGRALSRDVLAALFWPDEPDSTARTNFRQTLYQLRKLLEKGTSEERPYFVVTRQTVRFNPNSDYQCDVTAFLQALKLGDLATAVGHPDGCYAGELLPGFTCDSLEFEAWLRRERERLHRSALDALQQRTDWLLGSGNLAEAKALAQRQLALEPWRELSHRQLMQAHALAGDRQAAKAQFERCKAILWAELAVMPEPETSELAEKISAGDEITIQTRQQHNLIALVTPHFGREADLVAVRERITNRDYRLVTLVGEGGIGKSRLALEVAWQLRQQFADGVWFVPLAGVESTTNLEDAIATAVLQALDQPLAGQQPSKAQLLIFLRERKMLLVLDNFEPLLDGAGLVLDLLQQAKGVCIICTSREPLNFQAEWVLPLQRLPLPLIADPFLNTTAVPQDPTTFPAVQLFMDRAQRANGRFQLNNDNIDDIVTLCRLLAGLPLALELAAAALRHQTPPQLMAALQHSIDTLATRRRDIPLRHRSMRAVFDSSWVLLTEAERAQLASLSVFLGPFSETAAEAVTEATLHEIHTLVEKSLLQRQEDRFALHALLRQFAAEKLAGFPNNQAIVRHSHYYLRAVADLADALNGEMPHLAVQRIARAWENVKGAWATAVTHQDYSPILAALVPLSDFCQLRGFYREGLRLFTHAADGLQAKEQPEALAQLLTQQAAMYVRLSDYPQAIKIIEEALPQTTEAWLIARLNITWGEALWRQSQLDKAARRLHKALAGAQTQNFESLIGVATYHIGVVSTLAGKNEASLVNLEAALAIWQRLKNLRWQANTLTSMGFVAQSLNQLGQAESYLYKALNVNRSVQDVRGEMNTLGNLGSLFTAQQRFERAKKMFDVALQLAEQTGDRHIQGMLNYNLAWNFWQAGNVDGAKTAVEKARLFFEQVGDQDWLGKASALLGEVEMKIG